MVITVCLERGYDEHHLRLLSLAFVGIAAAGVIAACKLLWDTPGGDVTLAAGGTLFGWFTSSDLGTCLGL